MCFASSSQKILVVILGTLLVSACGESRQFRPFKPIPDGISFAADIRNYAYILRGSGTTDGPLSDPHLTAVTTEFGASVIAAQTFPFRSQVGLAAFQPWSSWWFPKGQN